MGLGVPLPEDPAERELEERARSEKAAALEQLFHSRLCVLIGPAGTGKTTLLRMLCSLPGLAEKGLLLLAPTGKARVRLEDQTGMRGAEQTLAQFLLRQQRYDGETGAYFPKPTGNGAVSNNTTPWRFEFRRGSGAGNNMYQEIAFKAKRLRRLVRAQRCGHSVPARRDRENGGEGDRVGRGRMKASPSALSSGAPPHPPLPAGHTLSAGSRTRRGLRPVEIVDQAPHERVRRTRA